MCMEYEGYVKRVFYIKVKFKKIFISWCIYVLIFMYVFWNNNGNFGGQFGFVFWLKVEGYFILLINFYLIIVLVFCIVLVFIYVWIFDFFWRGVCWFLIVIVIIVNLILYISMVIWNIFIGYKWIYYILSGFVNGFGGFFYVWVIEICVDDIEERVLVVGVMNIVVSVVQVWLLFLIWQQVDVL